MNIYSLRPFRLIITLILCILSLLSFGFSLYRTIPYSRSYPVALFGWASLAWGSILWRHYLSLRIELYRFIVAFAWLCPTFILLTLLQSVLSGFRIRSMSFFISASVIYGIPLYISIRKSSPVDIKDLRENFIQCLVLGLSVAFMSGTLELALRILGRDEHSLWVHPQDMHPNEIAHEVAADFVVKVLYLEEFKKDGRD